MFKSPMSPIRTVLAVLLMVGIGFAQQRFGSEKHHASALRFQDVVA